MRWQLQGGCVTRLFDGEGSGGFSGGRLHTWKPGLRSPGLGRRPSPVREGIREEEGEPVQKPGNQARCQDGARITDADPRGLQGAKRRPGGAGGIVQGHTAG